MKKKPRNHGKQRVGGGASTQINRQVLAWQTSTFLDDSQDLFNMLDLASKLCPSQRVFDAILDEAEFDTTAFSRDVCLIANLAVKEAESIKGEVDGELLALDAWSLAIHLTSQTQRLRYQEFGGVGWSSFVLNTEVQSQDGGRRENLRQAMMKHLPKLKALVEHDDMLCNTQMPPRQVVAAQRF